MSLHSDLTQLTMETGSQSRTLLPPADRCLRRSIPWQLNDGTARTLAAVDGPPPATRATSTAPRKLDIERQVNHTWFGPNSFKDCRKMGNDVIFQFVVIHTSRMAPSVLSWKPT